MFQEKIYFNRLKLLKNKLEPDTIYLLSNPSHISYFTGFEFLVQREREALLVLSHTHTKLIHTSFAPVHTFSFLEYNPGTFPSQLKQHIEKMAQDFQTKKLVYDDQTLFVAELGAIQEIQTLKTTPMSSALVTQLMNLKDANEITTIRTACKITGKVLNLVQQELQIGMTELEVAELIAQKFKAQKITELAFPTIVAFGAHSAAPHHQPTNKKLTQNTLVLIDLGGKFNGYCADMTRTFWFGDNPNNQFKKIEKVVQDAYTAALQTLQQHTKKSVLAKDVDNAARVHITNQGYGDHFIHTTGHGLGLDIHESPSLNWRNSDLLAPNMVITIEPGIYFAGKMGYRHENTVLITKKGVEILTMI